MPTVEFDGRPTPGLEAGVWILQLLAESLHRLFAANYARIAVDGARLELGLADFVRILGGFAAQRLPTVGDEQETLVEDRKKALSLIWDDFFNDNRIQKLDEKTKRLFEDARKESEETVRRGQFDFSWLEKAHANARQFIDQFLETRKLDGLPAAPEMKVVVIEDREARKFCASTQAGKAQIRWAHQSVPHALLSMVVADRVLAHEYLSHVIPRNKSLGRAITEQWLVALLQVLYDRKKAEPYWPNAIFRALRHDLEEHVAEMEKPLNRFREMVRSLGVIGVESAATDLLENAPERFWRLTDELFTIPAEEDVEQSLLDLMAYFAVVGPGAVEAALSRKYKNIKELHKLLAL
jgi:hypothetical protein